MFCYPLASVLLSTLEDWQSGASAVYISLPVVARF